MSDIFDPPGAAPVDPTAGPSADPSADLSAEASAKAEAPAEEGPFPWDEDPPPEDPDAPRQRHDAFTEARKSVYLRALVKTGCILDSCRLTGVSPRTIYRHQENDPSFFENCRIALRVSGTPAELTAWSRAVEGVEQEFACGGQVHVRRRYSDGLLRLLLQGSNPKKYGARPGFTRKRMLKHERKQMEREIRADIKAEMKQHERPPGEARRSILAKIEAIERHEEPKKLAAGWTKSEGGHWVPPGYAWVGLSEGQALPGAGEAGEGEGPSGPSTPRESV